MILDAYGVLVKLKAILVWVLYLTTKLALDENKYTVHAMGGQ